MITRVKDLIVLYQEEEHVVMIGRGVFGVHAEGSIHVAQVVMVI